MPSKLRIIPAAAFAVIIFLASCSKSNKEGKMVPKDAGIVLHIDSKSLSGKIDMAEIRQSDWFKEITSSFESDTTMPEFAKKLRENLKNSGIDSLADFVFFGENKNADGMKLVLEGGIKDAKAFEGFLKNIYPEGNIKKDGEFSLMPVKEKAVLTWNNEKFALGIQAPSASANLLPGFPAQKDGNDAENQEQMATYCKKLYTLKDDENLSKDEKFTELMKTEGDVHFWMNTEKLMNGSLQMGMLSMMKIDKFLEGNISTYTLNFDKGQIALQSKGYCGKELGAIFSKYSGGKINTDMIKNIPSQNLAAVFAFHFNPEGLRELVKLTGMDGFIDLLISRKGFTIDDFVKANKGDILFAVADLSVKKDSVSFTGSDGKTKTIYSPKPDASYIFSAAIGDKDAFKKLIRAAKDETGNITDEKVVYNSSDKFFAIGNSGDMVTKYLAGGGKNEPAFLSKISGNAIGGYADLQKIMKAFEPTSISDSINKARWKESLNIWDNVVITGGDYSGGGYNQRIEINLVDKNTNSLKQLFRYGMIMAELQKKEQKNFNDEFKLADVKMEEVKPDVTKVPPPPPPSLPKTKRK